MLDGYDEYKRGANEDIDRVIEMPDISTFVILTSRPGYVSKEMKNEMDGEVVIEGFNDKNIQKCSEKYLGSKEKSSVMLEQAEQAGIYKNNSDPKDSRSLLRVPIILLMICVIFEEKQSLPKTRTETVSQIFELTIDRTVLKGFSSSMYADVKEFQDALLCALGELSWKSLQGDEKQLLLKKVSC